MRPAPKEITAEMLHSTFIYKDGNLYWKKSKKGVQIERPAGTRRKDGYVRISIDKKLYYAHRLIFMMHHGYFPMEVDHKNRIKGDDKIENLRACTTSGNLQNASIRKDNSLGVRGVSRTANGKYRAYITLNGRQKWLGVFSDIESAKVARTMASNVNFKEFSNERI